MTFRFAAACLTAFGWLCVASAGAQQPLFRFEPPGELEPGSGQGLQDSTIYLPGIRFPVERAPAYLNSQVWRPGGQRGGGGGQCDSRNYAYPWRDNYCEARSWDMPMCPSGAGHQGVDIRPATCRADLHWAVAAEDGVIAQIGRYSVTLQTPRGTIYRYLHLNTNQLAVRELDTVRRGQRIGQISNHFGGTPTTIHLHLDVKDTIRVGKVRRAVHVPPYASLVTAYRELLAADGR